MLRHFVDEVAHELRDSLCQMFPSELQGTPGKTCVGIVGMVLRHELSPLQHWLADSDLDANAAIARPSANWSTHEPAAAMKLDIPGTATRRGNRLPTPYQCMTTIKTCNGSSSNMCTCPCCGSSGRQALNGKQQRPKTHPWLEQQKGLGDLSKYFFSMLSQTARRTGSGQHSQSKILGHLTWACDNFR